MHVIRSVSVPVQYLVELNKTVPTECLCFHATFHGGARDQCRCTSTVQQRFSTLQTSRLTDLQCSLQVRSNINIAACYMLYVRSILATYLYNMMAIMHGNVVELRTVYDVNRETL